MLEYTKKKRGLEHRDEDRLYVHVQQVPGQDRAESPAQQVPGRVAEHFCVCVCVDPVPRVVALPCACAGAPRGFRGFWALSVCLSVSLTLPPLSVSSRLVSSGAPGGVRRPVSVSSVRCQVSSVGGGGGIFFPSAHWMSWIPRHGPPTDPM